MAHAMLLAVEAELHGWPIPAGCLAGAGHVDTAHHPPECYWFAKAVFLALESI